MISINKISVIVPIYNTKDYLDTCISSIVSQTHSNLEIILIDDGSFDGSESICDAFAAQDSRIKVIHKRNGGQAEARNIGIAEATGAYIGFVDSDDFIAETMYAALIALSEKYHADLAGCGMQKFFEYPFTFEANQKEETVFSTEEAVADLFACKHFDNTVPNLLVRSEIAKNVLFDVGKIHEDVLWPYRVMREAKKVVFTSEKLYAYYQRPGSTMNEAYSIKRFDALDALQQRAKEIKTDFPLLYPRAERAYVGSCMYHYQYLCRLEKTKQYEEFKSILHRRFLDGNRKVAFADINLKYKIWYAMFARAPEFTCFIRNKLKIGL